MSTGRVIGEVFKEIQYAYLLLEAEGFLEDADHGEWDGPSDSPHLIPGSLAFAVRLPMEGAVKVQVLRDGYEGDLLPRVIFSGRLDPNIGEFVVSDPLETFRIAFSGSGLFEVRLDEPQAGQVQIIAF
ncbi:MULTISPECIES: hypothetical protein [unclassified Nocardiopsis]|uniref:hypothetical protein n=1 Tax=unclassified Nocardiopsis TaxID=2649073 RepID=UPI0011612DB1|nr:hypothetical protein [Nocardiopsis sp. TSRI0078]